MAPVVKHIKAAILVNTLVVVNKQVVIDSTLTIIISHSFNFIIAMVVKVVASTLIVMIMNAISLLAAMELLISY
jgi:hypothetical protein